MKKPKIFIACDTTRLSKVRRILKFTKSTKMKIGYKFGLEFMNSKNGRPFISKLKNKIIFVDLKLNDTVNTMLSAVKALKDLNLISPPSRATAGLIFVFKTSIILLTVSSLFFVKVLLSGSLIFFRIGSLLFSK